MSKAPWYKRFAADFVSDPYVRAMTYEQQGWYNAMLDLSWIHTPQGYLPNDKQMLSKCLGLLEQTSRQHFIDNCEDVLTRFKISEDGAFLYHPKMLEQAEHMTQVSEKRRDAGKSGGRKPVNQLQSKCLANAKQLPIDSDKDTDIDNNNINTTVAVAAETPKKRRTTKDIISGFSEETKSVVNGAIAVWPTVRPGNNSPVRIDTAKLADRVDRLLKQPGIDAALLMEAAKLYLDEKKEYLHAPEYFFGPGKNSDDPPWRPYARMAYHNRSQVAQ